VFIGSSILENKGEVWGNNKKGEGCGWAGVLCGGGVEETGVNGALRVRRGAADSNGKSWARFVRRPSRVGSCGLGTGEVDESEPAPQPNSKNWRTGERRYFGEGSACFRLRPKCPFRKTFGTICKLIHQKNMGAEVLDSPSFKRFLGEQNSCARRRFFRPACRYQSKSGQS